MEKDYKVEIDGWLETLTTEEKLLVWELVKGVHLDWKLLGKKTFSLPDDKLIGKIAYTDAIKILQQLHDKGIIGFKDLVYDSEITIKPPFNYLASKLNQQLNKKELDKKFVLFENDSLIIQLPDGSSAPIVFNTRSGNRDMLSIFEIMFDQWKNSAELRDGWLEVIVTKDTLIGELAKKGRADISGNWIKDTVSNIRNLKIKPSKLNKFVSLGYFDSKTKGWPFRIKRPTS